MSTKWVATVLALGICGTAVLGQDEKPKVPKQVARAKGQLPANWKQLGLTDEQIQTVYRIQNKYNDEIDKLETQIKNLKEQMAKERSAVLTAEQKKRLEDIIREKVGGDQDK